MDKFFTFLYKGVVGWSRVDLQCWGVLLFGYSRARAYCACSGAGRGCLDILLGPSPKEREKEERKDRRE